MNTELRSWLEPTGWPSPCPSLSPWASRGPLRGPQDGRKAFGRRASLSSSPGLSLKHPQPPSPGCSLGAEPRPIQPPSLAQSPSFQAADQTGGGPLLSYHMRLFKNSRQRKEKTYRFRRLPWNSGLKVGFSKRGALRSSLSITREPDWAPTRTHPIRGWGWGLAVFPPRFQVITMRTKI